MTGALRARGMPGKGRGIPSAAYLEIMAGTDNGPFPQTQQIEMNYQLIGSPLPVGEGLGVRSKPPTRDS